MYYDHHICIVCNGRTGRNHKCPPKLIASIEARRIEREPRISNPDWYGTRLQTGFAFYGEDYNHDN